MPLGYSRSRSPSRQYQFLLSLPDFYRFIPTLMHECGDEQIIFSFAPHLLIKRRGASFDLPITFWVPRPAGALVPKCYDSSNLLSSLVICPVSVCCQKHYQLAKVQKLIQPS